VNETTPSHSATPRVSLLTWLGHHSATGWFVVAAGAALGALNLDPALSNITFLGSILLAVAVRMAAKGHDASRCLLCRTELPLVGAAQAARYEHDLRRAHRGGTTRWLIPLYSSMLVSLFIEPPQWLAPLALSVLFFGIGLNYRAVAKHVVLFHWCMYCNNGRGGGGFDDPVLDPTPVPVSNARP
jgi:hypothetical protein